MIIEKIYNGRDNTVDLLLKADGAAVDLAAVTRMQLVVGATTIDSQTHPTYFDWSPTPAVTGKLLLTLGAAGLSVGERQVAQLVVFDPSNPLGLVWGSFYMDVA
jgi:hypothetical protein